MIGSDEILAEIRRLLQIDLGETTFDGRFTLEASECIGQCDQAPSISIDDTIFGNLTPSRLKPILERFMK
jgi:NADH:ubiquinone oxidoreductase subunit E